MHVNFLGNPTPLWRLSGPIRRLRSGGGLELCLRYRHTVLYLIRKDRFRCWSPVASISYNTPLISGSTPDAILKLTSLYVGGSKNWRLLVVSFGKEAEAKQQLLSHAPALTIETLHQHRILPRHTVSPCNKNPAKHHRSKGC